MSCDCSSYVEWFGHGRPVEQVLGAGSDEANPEQALKKDIKKKHSFLDWFTGEGVRRESWMCPHALALAFASRRVGSAVIVF